MKKNIAFLTILAGFMFSTSSGYAQTGEPGDDPDRQLDRQVDVSRDYTPDVDKAAKLLIVPDMTDTVALRPDFEYTIKPSAWVSGFGVAAINPVRVDASTYNPLYPFYLKAGGGFPGLTLLDFYGASTETRNGSFGGYINHYGQYGKIKNDLGFKAKAMQNNNSAGIFGKTNVGSRMSLEGKIGFDYDVWSRYGQAFGENPLLLKPENPDSEKQSYFVPKARIVFGNDFSDLSYFNFRLGAEGYHISDKEDNAETGIGAFVELGKMFSVHRITLKGVFDGTFGAKDRDDYYNRIFSIGPRYGIVTEKFKFGFGGDFVYDVRAHADNKSYFMPEANITLDVTRGSFVPYVTLDSRIINNGFYNLTRINPYLDPEAALPFNTREYNLRGGIAGSISSNFSYRVYVGGTVYRDPVFFFTSFDDTFQTAAFDVLTDKRMNVFMGGADLDGRISGSFMAGLSGRYYNYSPKNLEYAIGCPDFEAELYIRYNYRDKFLLRAGATLIGKRYFYETSSIKGSLINGYYILDKYISQKAAVDISLEAEYFFQKEFGIFLLGRNLGNSKIYRFNHYPDQGINISAGVKLLF